jgi:glucose dehydrogenase
LLLAALLAAASQHAEARPGDLLWEDRFDPERVRDWPAGVAAGGGKVVVVAESGPWENLDILVRAYDGRTGAVAWEDRVDPAGGWDTPLSVVAGDAAVYVAGNVEDPLGTVAWLVRAYDLRSGALLWEDVHLDGSFASAETIALAGRQLVATGFGGTGCFPDCTWITRSYDARSGELLWDDRFDVPWDDGAPSWDQGVGVAVTHGVVVTGGSGTNLDTELSSFLVRAFDGGSGELLWQDRHDGPGAFLNAVHQLAASGGRVFAVGELDHDWLVRAYRPRSGKLLWERTFALTEEPAVFDVAWQVATDGKHVVVAGYGSHADSFVARDWVVNAYDAKSGRTLWSDVEDNGGVDEAVGGVAIHDGQAFVSGAVVNASGGLDVQIRAYDVRSGRVRWEDQVAVASFPPGIWYRGLAVQRDRVTIVGWAQMADDPSIPADGLDTIVRTYDASNARGRGAHDEKGHDRDD